MADYMIRVIAKEAGVRGLACFTTELAQEAAQRHETKPAATVALAEGLTSAALLGALLKVQQRIALKFEGNGPLKKILAESNAYGKIRGYVANPDVDLPLQQGELDVAEALGNVGLLTVVKDLKLKELAESVVPIAGESLEHELTYYLTQSEQIPSFVNMGVVTNDDGDIELAGGLLIQALPPYQEEIVDQLQDRMEELPPLADLLRAGETPESVLEKLFADIEYDILEKRDLIFHCGCSRERTEKALISLGINELTYLLEEEGGAEVNCHFCHEHYVFTPEDLEGLIAELE